MPATQAVAPACPGLFYIDDEPADVLRSAMQRAAAERELGFWPLHSAHVKWSAVEALPPGSLLYCRSTTERALVLESWLWSPQVASIYRRGPGRAHTAAVAGFAHRGVPIPRTRPVLSATRSEIDAAARELGGLPLVLRFAGFSGGRGVVFVDSPAGLYSAVDHALATGAVPELVEYVAGVAWRVAVVAGRAIAATRGHIEPGDFRSRASTLDRDYLRAVPPHLAAPAIAAAHVTDVDAAGVDLIERPDGSVVVLESNTPFYFGHLEERGVDVAGPLLDALLARAAALGDGDGAG